MLTLPQAIVCFLIQLLVDHGCRAATVSSPLLGWWQSRRQSHNTVRLVCIEGVRGGQDRSGCLLLRVVIATSCTSLVIKLLDELDDAISPVVKDAGPCCHTSSGICQVIVVVLAFYDLVGA